VSFVDVAQGDSIVGVDAASRQAVVVDCPTYCVDLTERALRANGGNAIHTLILSHLHADHIGDALELIDRLPVRRVRTNVASNPRRTVQVTAMLRAIAALADDGVEVLPATAGAVDRVGELDCRILAPTHARTLDTATRANANHGCVVCVLTAHGRRWLLTSDATGETWERLLETPAELRADVIQLPHHGGGLATRDDLNVMRRLLSAVDPADIVVSVGTVNAHGHPQLDHLELAGAAARLMCTQVNAGCLGQRPLPLSEARRLPSAAYSAGGGGEHGCSCAGTISYTARASMLSVSPTGSEHAVVVDALEHPRCRLAPP
jgi:competence protein ComEC